MTSEEFQRIVIEALKELKDGQKALEGRQAALERRQAALESRQAALDSRQVVLEEGLKDIYKLVKVIQEQTAELAELRTEINNKLVLPIEDSEVIKEIVGRHELDIRTLQRKIGRRIV